MGVLCFIYLIASLRTNVMFFTIFLTLTIAFGTLSGAYWNLAKGTPSAEAHAGKLQIVGGRALALPYLELVANLLRDRSLALFCLLRGKCNACCLPPWLDVEG